MTSSSGARLPVTRPAVPEEAVAAVLARAAELDVRSGHDAPPVALDEDALVEIGAAVGLSPDAIRRAVAEHHAGALVASPATPGTWVGPRLAVVERRVAGDADRVRRSVERDLERQWFRKVRGHGERSVWCARTDLAARVARRVDLRHRLVLTGVTGVVLTAVACGPDDVAVRVEADPAERRAGLGRAVTGATAGGAALGAVVAGVLGLDPALLLAIPAGALPAGVGGLALARRAYVDQVRRLVDDLEGILDRAVAG